MQYEGEDETVALKVWNKKLKPEQAMERFVTTIDPSPVYCMEKQEYIHWPAYEDDYQLISREYKEYA